MSRKNITLLTYGSFRVYVMKITIRSEFPFPQLYIQSRAINFDRQGHSLTQSKMLHCKTVVNIITYHYVV
jgi:hypothetical protein